MKYQVSYTTRLDLAPDKKKRYAQSVYVPEGAIVDLIEERNIPEGHPFFDREFLQERVVVFSNFGFGLIDPAALKPYF